MTILYEYSKGNRLENPHSYMYTHYIGEKFLQIFLKSRENCIKKIGFSYNEKELLSHIYFILKQSISDETYDIQGLLKRFKNNEKIQTKVFFEEIALLILNSQKKEKILLYPLLNDFCKKYEISKKLFSKYLRRDEKLKPESKDYSDLTIYTLLSFCLLHYHKCFFNLRFLNCSLKINDMLCSRVTKIVKENDLVKLTFYANLVLEKQIIDDLLEIKRIKL